MPEGASTSVDLELVQEVRGHWPQRGQHQIGAIHGDLAAGMDHLTDDLGGGHSPDFSPMVWKKAVPRGIICSGSTGYADRRGRPYEHRV
jgi:hypothetical protein